MCLILNYYLTYIYFKNMALSIKDKTGYIQMPVAYFRNHLRVLLDEKGKVLHIAEWRNAPYASMAEEILSAVNIHRYFDLSPYRRLGDIPGVIPYTGRIKRDFDKNIMPSFFNHRPFSLNEDPESFYTALPTAELRISCRFPDNTFLGLVLAMHSVPRLYLTRPSGIIYVDARDRLVGFNHAFYNFFKEKHAKPHTLLNKPVSGFFSPTPRQIQEDQVNRNAIPLKETQKSLLDIDFRKLKRIKGVQCAHPAACRLTAQGLVCHNSAGLETLLLTVVSSIKASADFMLTVEGRIEEGQPPLFVLGGRHKENEFPDVDGYLIGPHFHRDHLILKRKGIVYAAGAAFCKNGNVEYTLAKVNNTLHFLENGVTKLCYYDANFLHHPESRLYIGFRLKSRFTLDRLFLGTTAGPVPTTPPYIPIIRLNTPAQHYFILNDLKSASLSTNFPDVSAFILENITDVQKKMITLNQENLRLLAETGQSGETFIGKSPNILFIKKQTATVAASDATVLIQGETGTGKEVLAKFIHSQSPCREGPFVKVDCSTIPATLMESELFGHEKGAFTGAVDRKIGYLEQADNGTLFLDEVGNLSMETQAKLLHFLQDHVITRVGGESPVNLNLRVVAATNTPLKTLVERKLFRSDLYYRLEVVTVTLPPLRDRMEDMPDLCRHFIGIFNAVHGKRIKDLASQAYGKIYRYHWPGNIRELRNAVERAVIFCEAKMIGPELVNMGQPDSKPVESNVRQYRFLKKDIKTIKQLFKKHRGNAKRAARELGVSRGTLYNAVRKSGCTMNEIRSAISIK
jgi:DNA-binding NtrC family response regulator